MKVVTAEEMRSIEQATADLGIPLPALMQLAGAATARAAAEAAENRGIVILAGPGNNGGDGMVTATRLQAEGYPVTVYTYRRADLMGYPGQVIRAEDDSDRRQLTSLAEESAVIVDALLGTGQNRPPDQELATILDIVNERRGSRSVTIAVDVPTGVNSDTGAVSGSAIRADVTLCMGFAKCGVALYPGAERSGIVRVADIGIPRSAAQHVTVTVSSERQVAELLPVRDPNGSKGSSGRLLVVAGSRDFLGAPALVSMAAYRAGAGLVEVGCLQVVGQVVASHWLEPVFLFLPEEDGRVAPAAMDAVATALDKAKAMVFGPGLGLSPGTIRLTEETVKMLARQGRPSVIDADGLNALSRIPHWWEPEARIVLTPHPGEMSRLTGLSIEEVQSDRLEVARRHAHLWGKVVVLKGAGTVIAAPDGRVAINPTGGPNLATAGTGDVLSGIIGGLLAQGCSPFDAAVAGVYLHGRAGDILRAQDGDVGTVAGDLIGRLPAARRSILQGGKRL